MIEIKRAEIRDRLTFIGAIALRITGDPADRLMWRMGFSDNPLVALVKLSSDEWRTDPYQWPDSRTMGQAHLWLAEHWEEHADGAVIDVEFILGETTHPKLSEFA